MTLSATALECAKQISRVNAAGTAITDLEVEIKDQIRETIRFYNRQPYALTEFRGATLTTAVSTVWYSSVDLTTGDGDQSSTGRAAVDVKDILDLTYMRENPGSSGLNEPMYRVSYKQFESMFEGSSPVGPPTYFTIYAGQVGIWPTPDATYTIYFSAHIKPPVPVNDGDDSVWFTEAGEMIEAGACKRVCAKHLRDIERAAAFGAMEETARANLQREHVLKSSSGRLKSHA